jgi:hypothetical protein
LFLTLSQIDFRKPLLTSQQYTISADLLSQTQVRQAILASTSVVPSQVLNIVPHQGGHLSGSLSIAGGMENNLGMSLVPYNRMGYQLCPSGPSLSL